MKIHKPKIKTIAVMTSGGDAPGMNAALRAVVRTACFHQMEVYAIHGGYEGMIEGDFEKLDAPSVGGIIHKGGTVLLSSRCERFHLKKWRRAAYQKLTAAGIEAVILIGGNGSLAGAAVFTKEFDLPIIGVPKTIDNDIYGTDYAIGYDTAANTALEALDKLRDTANSHHRLFFVEVMGRGLGYIALYAGVAAGAEAILIPEHPESISHLIDRLEKGWERKKKSLIVVVAEGAVEGGAAALAEKVKKRFTHYDVRVSILGHIQRGGNPTCFDRMLASRLGHESVKALLAGKQNIMVGLLNNQLKYTPLKAAAHQPHKLNLYTYNMSQTLSY